MSYDENFYNLYEEYLHEKTVRQAHDQILSSFHPDTVLDLGCGKNLEYFRHGVFSNGYYGIDLNAEPPHTKANYRNVDYSKWKNLGCSPDAFVSLFSCEITAPYKENYALYERIFKSLPCINIALVSGFFYSSKKSQNPIGETGGIVSYQTLEGIDEVQSSVFSEKRITLSVPSKLFGDDVFEVWKFLERK